MRHQALLLATAAIAMTGCGGDDPGPPPIGGPGPTPSPSPTPSPTPAPTVALSFDFTRDAQGWDANFAEYSLATEEDSFAFASGLRTVPANVGGQGFLLGADNRSDDLLMYLWTTADGLRPGQRYRVDAEITFATDVPPGCVGIGGSPGDSVYIRAGANDEPVERRLTDSFYAVNIDHGGQSQSGDEAVVIGDFVQTEVTGDACDKSIPYSRKTLSIGADGPVLTADAQGRLYPFMATDSGFEGRTEIYWLTGEFVFTPVR